MEFTLEYLRGSKASITESRYKISSRTPTYVIDDKIYFLKDLDFNLIPYQDAFPVPEGCRSRFLGGRCMPPDTGRAASQA